eukprot:CAMPEP_0119315438 /NCGR_PEP_ID=MMETSP1333-20130426/35849_1 /TAXON_ID=418940 /ORGANISM="Scyphosphaera apsteinii, Strain RCC1455" /LENGTH=361 /DNA_ID=CAMNT_0007320797 /DNA_START=19 /DNA_END=1104 /DNA_ORIENTATION=-
MRESKCPFMRLTFFILSLAQRASHALSTHLPGAASLSLSSGGDLIVLGAGWVGSRLAARLLERGNRVRVTNRPNLQRKVPYFQPLPLPAHMPRHEFDLASKETWASLPPPETLKAAVLTFATTPALIEPFWEQYLQYVPQVICYSSTAVYRVDEPGQIVREDTPLRETPRALAETYMQDRGATVLTISGIFAEARGARGVCTCLAAYTSSGGALNGRKSVNMVHVKDIIEATAMVLTLPREHHASRLNVGGYHFLLGDLCSHCQHPPIPNVEDVDLSSKRVCSGKLLSCLPRGFSFVEPFQGCSVDQGRHAVAGTDLTQEAGVKVPVNMANMAQIQEANAKVPSSTRNPAIRHGAVPVKGG